MSYKTFLFTYQFEGSQWELEMKAKSRDEAQARMKVLPFAKYTGEQMAKIHVVSWWERWWG